MVSQHRAFHLDKCTTFGRFPLPKIFRMVIAAIHGFEDFRRIVKANINHSYHQSLAISLRIGNSTAQHLVHSYFWQSQMFNSPSQISPNLSPLTSTHQPAPKSPCEIGSKGCRRKLIFFKVFWNSGLVELVHKGNLLRKHLRKRPETYLFWV